MVHPDVDRAFIGRLVREFYGRVRRDERLGPIFAAEISGSWEPHLEKMTDFWCSVILKDGSYSGRPVPAPMRLQQVREADFDVWLGHFRTTVEELCPDGVGGTFVDRAERIAKSLTCDVLPPRARFEAERWRPSAVTRPRAYWRRRSVPEVVTPTTCCAC